MLDKALIVSFPIWVLIHGVFKSMDSCINVLLLGSLVARIVFLPIEESSRAYFSKTLTNPSSKQDS